MYDASSEARYEVELMLGATDPSHIIRAIEYWDMERQKKPLAEHRAVLVAEEITSRFFNVIRLLNRAVPLMAIQLSAFKFNDEVVLQFVTVLNTYEFADDDEEAGVPAEQADRIYWERRARPEALKTVDALVDLIKASGSIPLISYNRGHIAIETSGLKFARCFPRKFATHCPIRFKTGSEHRPALLSRLEAVDLEVSSKGPASIQMFLTTEQISKHAALITDVVKAAEEWSLR